MHNVIKPLTSLLIKTAAINIDPQNAREHGEQNLEVIKNSLTKFGQRIPLVVQKTGMICRAGNGRLLAMRDLGWDECAAVVVPDDDINAVAFAIADNRSAELATWNGPVLQAFLDNLKANDFDVEQIGYSNKDLAKLLDVYVKPEEKDDLIPEVKTHVVQLGDLWELGEHRMLCGDSTKKENYAKLLGTEAPAIMVTDPPYGVQYDTAWYAGMHGGRANIRRDNIQNDDRASWYEAYQYFQGNVYYIWMGPSNFLTLFLDLQKLKIDHRTLITWAKPGSIISRGHYHHQTEFCIYAVRHGKSADWIGDRQQNDLWQINQRAEVVTIHPTQKPLECMARPIRNHGKVGDLVYDPFLGSGTTLIAAEKMKRKCYGIELDPEFCDVIIKRWEVYTGQTAKKVSK